MNIKTKNTMRLDYTSSKLNGIKPPLIVSSVTDIEEPPSIVQERLNN